MTRIAKTRAQNKQGSYRVQTYLANLSRIIFSYKILFFGILHVTHGYSKLGSYVLETKAKLFTLQNFDLCLRSENIELLKFDIFISVNSKVQFQSIEHHYTPSFKHLSETLQENKNGCGLTQIFFLRYRSYFRQKLRSQVIL